MHYGLEALVVNKVMRNLCNGMKNGTKRQRKHQKDGIYREKLPREVCLGFFIFSKCFHDGWMDRRRTLADDCHPSRPAWCPCSFISPFSSPPSYSGGRSRLEIWLQRFLKQDHAHISCLGGEAFLRPPASLPLSYGERLQPDAGFTG